MTVTGDDSLVGSTIDQRYVVHERIARGGMANVYRATDLRLDRVVAVKVMHPNLGDPDEFRARFEREAKASARLSHPGIVAVFDQGQDGNLTYLVMEYVPGHTLRDVMRDEAPMDPQRALGLVANILEALTVAHAAGIVHRDIKPENVLISEIGQVKVADFGLARAVSSSTTHTRGALIGTVSYLAPEVVTNSGADARADVYSCGAMLFEMLTGRKPHVAETPIQVAYLHVNEDIAPPSSLRPEIPDYVDALVARATSRDPDKRSRDAKTLLVQLQQVRRALAQGDSSDTELTTDLAPYSAPEPAAPRPRTAAEFEATALVPRTWSPTEPINPLSVGVSTATTRVEVAEPESEPEPRRRPRRGPMLLLLAVGLLAATAALGWWLAVGRYAPAPDVTRMPQAAAVGAIKKAGFTADVTEAQFSETVPKGEVISSSPTAGQRILPGDTISVVVSKGKERYRVPELAGVPLDDATSQLGARHLAVGAVTRDYSDKVAKDHVVEITNLAPGDLVRRDTKVNLLVSNGPAPVTVADYTGKSASDAIKAIGDAGLRYTSTDAFDDKVAKGNVISQTPSSGTVHRGDTITLKVSKGPEQVQVPDFAKMTEDQAKAAAKQARVKLSITKNPFAQKPVVRYQDKDAGSKVKPGTTIVLILG